MRRPQALTRREAAAGKNSTLLLLLTFPRYNQSVLRIRIHARGLLVMAPGVAALAGGCVAPLGPGYTIEKQQVHVQVGAAPEPRIRIEAEDLLKKTRNRPPHQR